MTDRRNIAGILNSRSLHSSAELLRRAGRLDLLRVRRRESFELNSDGEFFVLNDQRPLVMANVLLPSGWTAGDLVALLNHHVYFWPGTAAGPSGAGRGFLSYYRDRGRAVIKVRTADLLDANPGRLPFFCACNSGALRQQPGRGPVPRGPSIFIPAGSFNRAPSRVIELVFENHAGLPERVEVL